MSAAPSSARQASDSGIQREKPKTIVDSPNTPTAASILTPTSCLRSEEHTSELQSRQYLVCRLLLEKKERSRMVGRGRQAAEARHPPPRVLRCGEDHFLEDVERHVAAARVGEHVRAWIEQLHGAEVD